MVVVLLPSVAAADTYGNTSTEAGAGKQYAIWNKSTRKIRLRVNPYSSMSPDRCMDAMLDWLADGHYDSRVVRSCLPGTDEESDPGGDGYWVEPSSWGDRSVTNMQKGFGYVMDDDFGETTPDAFFVDPEWRERFSGSENGAFYPSPPRTTVDCWARTRTRYQNGSVDWTPDNGFPVNNGGTVSIFGNC